MPDHPQTEQLRVLLASLHSRGEERGWLRNQSLGDLDDSRIVEGLVGEQAIFRRRGPPPPPMHGLPQVCVLRWAAGERVS